MAKITVCGWAVVVHVIKPSTREVEASGSEFKTSLVDSESQDIQDHTVKPCLGGGGEMTTVHKLTSDSIIKPLTLETMHLQIRSNTCIYCIIMY